MQRRIEVSGVDGTFTYRSLVDGKEMSLDVRNGKARASEVLSW